MQLIARLKHLNEVVAPSAYRFAPEWIVLGVNNVCNLHCKMCDVGLGNSNTNFARNLTGSRPLNMPTSLLHRIIDQTAIYFPQTRVGFAFTEPLIYPGLIDAVAHASRNHLSTAVTTNGLHLPRHAEALANAGLKELFISLDGPPEAHNLIRGHRRSFELALEGVEKLVACAPRPEISVFCVITEWNYTRLAEFAALLSDYPLSRIGFMHTNFTSPHVARVHNSQWGNAYPATESNLGEMNLDQIDVDRLSEEIATIRGMNMPFALSFSPELTTTESLDIFYRHPELYMGRRCHDVYRSLMIKSDGSVIPAHGRCYNLTVGNVNETDLRAIWRSPVLSQLRADLKRAGGLMPACSRCCSAFD